MRFTFTGFMALLSLAAVAGCFGNWTDSIRGSGTPKLESRQVESFDKVKIHGSGDIQLLIGDKPELSVETDDNILPIIETVVEDGTLHVKGKESFSTRIGVKLRIVVPSLKAISIAGSGSVRAADLKEPVLSISIAGSGDISVKGTADAVDVSISGSGDVDTQGLVAKSVKVQISGSGAATVSATEVLDAQITGSGDIQYTGNPPTVKKNIKGVGNIKPIAAK